MQQRIWSLYNREDKLRVDELTQDQVRTIVLAISKNRMQHWFVCREGDLDWRNIMDVPELFDEPTENNGLPPRKKLSDSRTPTPRQAAREPARRPLFEDAPPEMLGGS